MWYSYIVVLCNKRKQHVGASNWRSHWCRSTAQWRAPCSWGLGLSLQTRCCSNSHPLLFQNNYLHSSLQPRSHTLLYHPLQFLNIKQLTITLHYTGLINWDSYSKHTTKKWSAFWCSSDDENKCEYESKVEESWNSAAWLGHVRFLKFLAV